LAPEVATIGPGGLNGWHSDDRGTSGADLVVHGHAHGGTEKGGTPGGIRVRNVARPVIQHPCNVYVLGEEEEANGASGAKRREDLRPRRDLQAVTL
jgi:hypothetical protein